MKQDLYQKTKKHLIILLLCVFACTCILIGSTYAYFSSVSVQEEANTIQVGTLKIAYDDETAGLGDVISLNNAFPISDTEGMKQVGYKFEITNTGTLNANYTVAIEDDQSMIDIDDCSDNLLSHQNIKYSVNGGTPTILSTKTNGVISEGMIRAGETIHYEIKMWIDESSGNEVLGKHFHGKVVINSVQSEDQSQIYIDDSGANTPELIEGLIPVTWNGSNWVKADTASKWYDYDEQMWANAVTVTSASRSEYNSAVANTVISMNDIETMWVWIPRYSYTIGNTYGVQGYGGSTPSQATPGAIDIKFIDSTTKELGIAQYTGDTPSEWRTPDGFTFGDQELSGIWVGKFETSGSTSVPTIKPDVTSLTNTDVSTMFTTSQKFTAESNRYGLSSTADSHMMKNSEWGVVAYLSQSKYGKYGNTDYTGANKEVYINDSSSYYTGRSQGSAPPSGYSSAGSYTYAIEGTGTGASTTGTIYGVYDMSGGAYEYTMSNYNNTIGSSGFSSMPESKYYDLYTSEDASTACNGGVCYGHALSETGGWYNDYEYMVNSSYPWALRGGNCIYGSNAGVFYFDASYGGSSSNYSFRLALVGA